MTKVGVRQIWEEAVRRLVDRYLKDHPGTTTAQAYRIVTDRHEEIGAEMDRIEGPAWFSDMRKGM